MSRKLRWIWIVPLVGIVVVVALPLVRYAQKIRAESAAASFLRRVQAAQYAFRSSLPGLGYAANFESLTTPCPNRTAALLSNDLAAVRAAGYEPRLRAAEGATFAALDCHGRQTVSDYYAAASPHSMASAGQQAFAATAAGTIFVFFDAIAPLEPDMVSGLATPLDSLSTFKIP